MLPIICYYNYCNQVGLFYKNMKSIYLHIQRVDILALD